MVTSNNSLNKALLILDENVWRRGIIVSDNSQVSWLPVTHLVENRFAEGITRDGIWVGESASGLLRIGDQRQSVKILPILQKSPSQVIAELTQNLSAYGLNAFVSTFPFSSIIVAGLTASSYWAELAMNWIEKYPFNLDELGDIGSVLKALSEDKKCYSQKARHRAKHLLSLFRR